MKKLNNNRGSLLLSNKIPDDQSDETHTQNQERQHHQNSNVLRLCDDTVWISFASSAGKSEHGLKRTIEMRKWLRQ